MNTVAALPSEKILKTRPIVNGEKHLHLFELEHIEHLPEMRLYKVENVDVFEDGSLFKNNKILTPSLRDPDNMLSIYTPWRMARRRWSYKKNQLDLGRTYLSLLDHWGHEYYHWMCEALPRLELALRHLENVTVILSERYMQHSFVVESLKRFPVQVVTLSDKTYARLPQLYFTDFPGPSDYHRKDLLNSLRLRFTQSKGVPNRKIYLSRLKSRFRKVLNDKEVSSFLKQFGFETIYNEDHSWEEQINIYANASHLISIHGAGLSNMIYMPQGSTVMEIRKDSYGINKEGRPNSSKLCNTYYHISQALDLKYSALLSQAPDPNGNYGYSDLTVNLKELEKLLQSL
jgi:hypothetical protein